MSLILAMCRGFYVSLIIFSTYQGCMSVGHDIKK